jgi:hypothetical protein
MNVSIRLELGSPWDENTPRMKVAQFCQRLGGGTMATILSPTISWFDASWTIWAGVNSGVSGIKASY